MTYTLRCRDIEGGCDVVLTASTEGELLHHAAVHAADDHGIAALDDERLAQLRQAISRTGGSSSR